MSISSPLFELTDQIKAAKGKIQHFVRDDSTPFDKRLALFVYTPDELMTTESSIIFLKKFSKKYGELNWYSDLDYERGSRIDLRELVADKTAHYHFETWTDEKYRDFQDAVLFEGIHEFYLIW